MKMLPRQPGETRKGRPHQPGRPKGPRREGLSFRIVPPPPPKAKTSGCSGPSPWRSRKYSDTRVTHSIPLSHCFPNTEYDYAGRHEPVSMYRRTAPWARRIWIAIHFRPPLPLALRKMPRYCLKRHRVEGRQSQRRLKATFRTTPPPPSKAKTSGCSGTSPWRSRKYSDARVTHSIPLSHCLS